MWKKIFKANNKLITFNKSKGYQKLNELPYKFNCENCSKNLKDVYKKNVGMYKYLQFFDFRWLF